MSSPPHRLRQDPAYIVPIMDHVLRNGAVRGIQAIVVYPMNALVS